MLQLYDKKAKPSNFLANLKNILVENKVSGLIRDKFILLIETNDFNVELIAKKTIKIQYELFFTNFKIIMGETTEKNKLIDCSHKKLCWSILKIEHQELIAYFNHISVFLSGRISDGKVITKNDAMVIKLAEIIEDIFIAKVLLEQSCYESVVSLKKISEVMQIGLQKLMQCAGGRGFIGGNVAEFFCFVKLVNNFLLGDLNYDK